MALSIFISSRRWMPSRPPTSPSPASTIGWPLASTSERPSTAPLQKASSRWNVAEPRHGTNTATGVSPSPRSSRRSTPLIAAETAAVSMTSPSSGSVGAITGTLRSGSVSIGETIDRAAADLRGVLRGADHGGADAFVRRLERRAPALDARADLLRQQHAEIAVGLRLAAVDVFGDAAGERDLGRSCGRGVSGSRRQRPEPSIAGDAALHRLEQPVGHARRQRACARLRRQRRADLELDAELGGEAPAGFLDAHDLAGVVDADEPRADVDRGEVDRPCRRRRPRSSRCRRRYRHSSPSPLSRIERATAPEP